MTSHAMALFYDDVGVGCAGNSLIYDIVGRRCPHGTNSVLKPRHCFMSFMFADAAGRS